MDTGWKKDIGRVLDAGLQIAEVFYSAMQTLDDTQAAGSYEYWSAADVFNHITAWLDFSNTRLQAILDNTSVQDSGIVESFNRRIWDEGRTLTLQEAYDACIDSYSRYRKTALRFSEADLQRCDFPTGFDWPLWKYIYLDTLVHPAWHYIYHGISRNYFDQAVTTLHKAADLMREFSGGDDSAFNLFEMLDDHAGFRLACRTFAASFPDDMLVQALVHQHSGPLTRSLARTFDLSFSMIVRLIDSCPEEVWNTKAGGFIYWQQLLHTLSGTHYWLRTSSEAFSEPFADRKLYPELDGEPEEFLSKDELADYAVSVGILANYFFAARDDSWLQESAIVYDKLTNADIIGMQIRHLMYHAGHCECILRERGYPALSWED